MTWFANDVDPWLLHSWTSLANHLTRVQNIVIHGNSCNILYIIGSDNDHYLNQCWDVVNWTLGNKPRWNLNRNSHIFIQENAFQNAVWKILSQPQRVKQQSAICLVVVNRQSMCGLVETCLADSHKTRHGTKDDRLHIKIWFVIIDIPW